MSNEDKKRMQDRIANLLEELLKWIRVTSIPEVKRVLTEVLESSEERIAYQYSDGRPSQEVSTLCGTSFPTVTKWWKKWSRVGIAELYSVKGGERAKRLFSLEDLGIEIPQSE